MVIVTCEPGKGVDILIATLTVISNTLLSKVLLIISDSAGRGEYKKPEPNPALLLLGGKKLH